MFKQKQILLHDNTITLIASVALFLSVQFAYAQQSGLHIIPDHVGDSHFTSGPCPNIVPPDGATCPNNTPTCAAFYNPAILPAGYNSVSYCANVPAGIGFNAPGITMMSLPLNTQEQEAFLKAAAFTETFVKDNQTVIIEPYKVRYYDQYGNQYTYFGGNEYWNPVCAADAYLPPFTDEVPTIVANPNGTYSYQGLPETYTPVLEALQQKNASNLSPMALINYLPSQSEINVEWPPYVYAWEDNTDVASDLVSNFLVQPSANYPITGSAQPFTLCAAPAAMKMLGFSPDFAKNGHTIDDINSPEYNMNVTLAGTDGALAIPDAEAFPPGDFIWMYDSTQPQVIETQLPKLYFEKSQNLYLPARACSDPTQCEFPVGANPGTDLIGVFKHEIDHVLGLMQAQYYKVPGLETSIAYTYGTALFPLDLFDIDSDYVVPGYGHPGIHSDSDFTTAPRNHNTFEPVTVLSTGPGYPSLTPFTQFGKHDHAMVYAVGGSVPQYFPLMSDTVGNPDGDIQFQQGWFYGNTTAQIIFVDPAMVGLLPMNVVHENVQAAFINGTIAVQTIREYSELAANGWNIDYSTLKDPYRTVSPLAAWYNDCFDVNGVFTTSKDNKCKFNVTPGVVNH